MTFLTVWNALNNVLVLFFGYFLTIFIAGGWQTARQRAQVLALCPAMLAVQGVCWALWGTGAVQKLYPVITHLPLALLLILLLHKTPGVALVSVCTAYLLCQLPRWVELMFSALTGVPLAGQMAYTAALAAAFWLLLRYFVRAAHHAMIDSPQSLFLFGSFPLAYYLFDYATAVYSNLLYYRFRVIVEFLPTVLIVFYVLFLTAYSAQTRNRAQAELKQSRLESELKQSRNELSTLRHAETRIAVYQHDMRHHLTMIGGYLAAGRPDQALDYVRAVEQDVAAVAPRHICENEAVNLLCSAFAARARQAGVSLEASVQLPAQLPVSDTELCAMLSNGLENALHAVSAEGVTDKTIALYCGIRFNKLLLEIRNPYAGEVLMEDGLPVSARQGHGYGCRSIQLIAHKLHGLCTFSAEEGQFTLRIALPL